MVRPLVAIAIAAFLLCAWLAGFGLLPATAALSSHATEIPDQAPVLINPGFECSFGYYERINARGAVDMIPDGWIYAPITGVPDANSTRLWANDDTCGGNNHVERIEGDDSAVLFSRDIETPPEPGKPFDSAYYQQTAVVSGAAYSLSGWMLSLCGGSFSNPNDCPDSYYMAKMLGIDPTGGVDPTGDTVVWVEDRRNFVAEDGRTRIGWANLYTGTVAQAMTMTVFARVNSPFRWHGNHAFIDAFSLVRAPVAEFTELPPVVDGAEVTVTWQAEQSPDVAAIPGGTYQVLVDVQTRHVDAADWTALVEGHVGPGSVVFTPKCRNTTYQLRVRARAEQPPPPPEGASPNQRYAGVWSDPASVDFQVEPPSAEPFVGEHSVFLPLVANNIQC